MAEPQLASFAIDLSRLHGRTITSFYSNLVTRPTGRAVRMGLEQQLVELAGSGGTCLSILDFSQVRVLDYSCADEIVAKLLIRYRGADRPVDAYFLARGLQEHHLESIQAVLERHVLLLAAENDTGEPRLLGPSSPAERRCWSLLLRRRQARAAEIAATVGLCEEAVAPTLARFVAGRVAVPLSSGAVCPVPHLGAV
jgi:hypothetical protein